MADLHLVADDELGEIEDEDEEEKHTSDITEAEKVEFLQHIRAGLNRMEAARVLGYKGRHWRALGSPHSQFYDEDFARAYAEAIGSFEYAEHRLERLRAETQRRAMMDSDRLLEKMMMVHDPEWSVLRQKDVNVSINVLIQQVFKTLPTEKLEQLLAWLEEGNDPDTLDAADFMAPALPPAVDA
jgi:hypothetical protein